MSESALPPIYWINLARSADRRARMHKRLGSRGLIATRVEAIDAADPSTLSKKVRWSTEPSLVAPPHHRSITPIEAAVVASHLAAIQRAYADGHERALIFEDDVTFDLFDAWRAGWATLEHALPPRYGVLQLCVAALPWQLDQLFQKQELLLPTDGVAYASAAAYLIERAAMRVLLDAFERADHFDLTPRSAPAEMVLFGGPVHGDASFVGPLISRIPLFLYEGHDSDIAPDHNDFLRPSRAFVRTHHQALVANCYRSPFAPAEGRPTDPSDAVVFDRRPWRQQARAVLGRGLARLGIVPREDELRSVTYLSQRALALHHDASAVWVQSDQLASFVRNRLHRQTRPFVLITGGPARVTPSSATAARDEILRHPLLERWFAVHCDDAAIAPLPVGMEYESAPDVQRVERQGKAVWLKRERTPIAEQERQWQAVLQLALPIDERLSEPLLEPSTSPQLSWPQRMEVYGRHAVVVAPAHGFDCPEIWHALFMGCIVAVRRSSRTSVYAGLPVIVIDDPSDLSAASVAEASARFGVGFDRTRLERVLSMKHWLQAVQTVREGAQHGPLLQSRRV